MKVTLITQEADFLHRLFKRKGDARGVLQQPGNHSQVHSKKMNCKQDHVSTFLKVCEKLSSINALISGKAETPP
jgi:hypothetical protein